MKRRLALIVTTYTLIPSLFLSCFLNNKDSDKERDNLLLLGLFALSQSGCPVGNGGFWSVDFTTGEDICVRVEQKAKGSRIRIWEEQGLNSVRQSNSIQDPNYSQLLNELETNGIPKLYPAIGQPSDVNQDGVVDIVVLNLSRFFGGGAFVAGYFSPLDLFRAEGGLNSNQREIVFVDGVALADITARSLKRGKPNDTLSVIAHEIQHLVRFPYEIGGRDRTQPFRLPRTIDELNRILDTDALWINEGTSELASDIAGYGPQESRLACLRNDPGYGCSQGIQGKSLFQFSNRIVDYSMSYAWISYLYHNAGSNTEERNTFLQRSITSTSTSTRGRNISSLMNTYRNSAKFLANNSSINDIFYNLTENDTSKIFQRIQVGFLGNFFQYPNDTNTSARFGIGTAAVNISTAGGGNNLLGILPLPDSIKSLINQPSIIPMITNNPTLFELEPGQIYRVSGALPAFAESNDRVGAVVRGTASTEYSVFNADMKEVDGFAVAKQNVNSLTTMNIKSYRQSIGLIKKPKLTIPDIQKRAGISAQDYLHRRLAWKLLENELVGD